MVKPTAEIPLVHWETEPNVQIAQTSWSVIVKWWCQLVVAGPVFYLWLLTLTFVIS